MSTPPLVPETREEVYRALNISAFHDPYERADLVLSWIAAGREEALARASHDEVVELLDVLQRHGTHQNSCTAGLQYFLWKRRRHPVAPVEVFDERSG